MNKVLCEFCLDLVDYTVTEEKDSINIRNKEYCYTKKITCCNQCHNEINVNEILDENIKNIDAVYRKEENIISIEDINKILEKYNIGRKPLASLLSFGETTIIRYLDGDIPSKLYSDILNKILANPPFMLDILEKNKSSITETAYNKVLTALKDIDKISEDIDIITKYILNISEDITHLTLQKLLYYCQGFYKAFFGKFLFSEDCQAWKYGPVYVDTYNKYRSFGCSYLENIDFSDIEFLDDDKKMLTQVIVNSFGCYSGKALADMTHLETPWLTARSGIPLDSSSTEIITKENIGEYFSLIKDRYKMINISEIKKYSENQFNNRQNLSQNI